MQRPQLSTTIVDRIFERLTVRYGQRFDALYEGINEDLVRDDWGYELAHVREEAIDYALANLPEHVPNASQFRKLANSAPSGVAKVDRTKMLPMKPVQKPDVVARVLEQLQRQDAEPQEPVRVKWARNYVAMFETRKPLPREKEHLARALGILEAHYRSDDGRRELATLKAGIQAMVDSYNNQEKNADDTPLD